MFLGLGSREEEEDEMKSCSQPTYEQVSDAQNGQKGDKGLRFKIPSIKNQDEGRGEKS